MGRFLVRGETGSGCAGSLHGHFATAWFMKASGEHFFGSR